MSGIPTLAVTFSVVLALTFSDPVTAAGKQTSDIKAASRRLISDIHHMVNKAKDGSYLKDMRQDVVDLQNEASKLIDELSEEVPQCDVQYITKMASAGTGSHEVMTVLLAKDELEVLNGRLTLALAFLQQVTRLMDDELSLTTDVGPHLTAIVFGANVTLDIIDASDKVVKAASKAPAQEGNERVRRLLNYNLGKGWSVGLGGVKWRSQSGRFNFQATPTFSGGLGARASFTWRF